MVARLSLPTNNCSLKEWRVVFVDSVESRCIRLSLGEIKDRSSARVFLTMKCRWLIFASNRGCSFCREVPRPAQVPAAQNDLGRRGDVVLLQGEIEERLKGLVRHQPLPFAPRKEGTGGKHRPHHHASQQLVQEQEAEGSGS